MRNRYQMYLTSKIQVPCGYSPQVWVVINGHFVKPSLESSSFCLLLKIIDLVPIGDVRNSSRSPRLVAFTVKTAWTCSKYRTSVFCPSQALVSMVILTLPVDGMRLKHMLSVSNIRTKYIYLVLTVSCWHFPLRNDILLARSSIA